MEHDDDIRLAMIKESIQRLEKDASDYEDRLEKKFNEYVLKIAFEAQRDRMDDRIKPLERLVYGMVGLILIAVITALVATVVVS